MSGERVRTPAHDLAASLVSARQPLKTMPAADIAKIVQRVADPHSQASVLDVAAFNSSI